MSRQTLPLPWLLLAMTITSIFQEGYADNLKLTFKHDKNRLDIRCSFQGHQNSTISHVTSMVLSSVKGDIEEVLTSASCFFDNNANLLGATKSSKISLNNTSESFINLHWDNATKDVDGIYQCELYGFDKHYNQVILKETKQVIVPDNPSLEVNPLVVHAGLIRKMDVNCSITDDSSINIKKVVSIELKTTRPGVSSVLASVDVFGGSEVTYVSENAQVTSKLGQGDNFLALSWTRPSTNLTGRYVCVVTGQDLDSQKHHVQFVRYIDVEVNDASVGDLISHIHTMEDRNDELFSQITENNKTIEVLKEKVEVCENPPQSCDGYNFTLGRHQTTLMIAGKKVNVICEVESPGIVWTIFHRRFDGTVDFKKNFFEYENGFGSTYGEYWLGLKNIKHLIGDRNHYLRVSLKDKDGSYTRNYQTFGLSAGPKYTLNLGSNLRGPDYGLKYNHGQDFSTFDYGPEKGCAKTRGGGWFYNCTWSNLMGTYGKTGEIGLVWRFAKGTPSLTAAEMKFRPA